MLFDKSPELLCAVFQNQAMPQLHGLQTTRRHPAMFSRSDAFPGENRSGTDACRDANRREMFQGFSAELLMNVKTTLIVSPLSNEQTPGQAGMAPSVLTRGTPLSCQADHAWRNG